LFRKKEYDAGIISMEPDANLKREEGEKRCFFAKAGKGIGLGLLFYI